VYVLDTVVVSELRKAKAGKADRRVIEWASGVAPSVLFLSVITVLELEQGILLIQRLDVAQGGILRAWLDRQVLPTFAGRVLPIDTAVAQRCAGLHVPSVRAERDALIAATALAHGMAIVTRNVADFEPTGAQVVNPWAIAA